MNNSCTCAAVELKTAISFKRVTIEDRELLNGYLLNNPYGNCDFAFSNIFMWRDTYKTAYAIVDGFLVLTSEGRYYLMPIGDGDIKKALIHMINDAHRRGIPFKMLAVTPEMEMRLNEVMPGCLTFKENRDWSDYIYLSEDLITLKGKKLHAKRNHINRFMNDHPDFEYLEVASKDIPALAEMHEKWCEQNYERDNEEQWEEARAVKQALAHFDELGLKGGAIKAGGEVVAFTLGQPINNDTFGVQIEKALPDYAAAYSVINQCFARSNALSYKYINREEDLGIEGLRRAKLSYNPVRVLDKKIATLKGD